MITADTIRAARIAAKQSQAAFGIRLGVVQSTIHRWEAEGPPKRPLVQASIARALRDFLVCAPSFPTQKPDDRADQSALKESARLRKQDPDI